MNVALFGKTAKQWREENPGVKGNIRGFATIEQLIVMVNLENMNARMINQGLEQKTRIIELNKISRNQFKNYKRKIMQDNWILKESKKIDTISDVVILQNPEKKHCIDNILIKRFWPVINDSLEITGYYYSPKDTPETDFEF